MGNTSSSIKKVNFENIIDYQKKPSGLLISTLPQSEQSCLINKTILCSDEENVITNAQYHNKNINIYVYGKNSHDATIISKAKQLTDLGFSNVYVYVGGLFEWLLLQEIYGAENFKTTGSELDLLKYRPPRSSRDFDQLHLTNFSANN
jgi:rhodanese-related sulfurtransferase